MEVDANRDESRDDERRFSVEISIRAETSSSSSAKMILGGKGLLMSDRKFLALFLFRSDNEGSKRTSGVFPLLNASDCWS